MRARRARVFREFSPVPVRVLVRPSPAHPLLSFSSRGASAQKDEGGGFYVRGVFTG